MSRLAAMPTSFHLSTSAVFIVAASQNRIPQQHSALVYLSTSAPLPQLHVRRCGRVQVRVLRGSDFSFDPPLMLFGAVSPVYNNHPVFYVMHTSADLDFSRHRATEIIAYWADLSAATTNPFRQEYSTRYAYDLRMLTNQAYLDLILSFVDGSQSGEQAFQSFFSHYKVKIGLNRTLNDCNTSGVKFHECATCVGACRVDLVCLLLAGLNATDYAECLRSGSAIFSEWRAQELASMTNAWDTALSLSLVGFTLLVVVVWWCHQYQVLRRRTGRHHRVQGDDVMREDDRF